MIVFIYNPIPVLHQPIVVIPRTVQLVMRKSQVILCPSNWIRVCLISKVNIWYIKVIGQNFSPISTITIYKKIKYSTYQISNRRCLDYQQHTSIRQSQIELWICLPLKKVPLIDFEVNTFNHIQTTRKSICHHLSFFLFFSYTFAKNSLSYSDFANWTTQPQKMVAIQVGSLCEQPALSAVPAVMKMFFKLIAAFWSLLCSFPHLGHNHVLSDMVKSLLT